MTFLPIIARELRARARTRGTYWTRLAVALIGVLLCVGELTVSGPLVTPAQTGGIVFDLMTSAAFLLCCGASLLAAEAIGSERREGTLGLLFLTRVRSFDVLAAKLVSVGTTCLCALVGLLPALMLPALAGGVTPGAAFHKAVALAATLLFTLCAGLRAAAAQPQRTRAAFGAVLIVALAAVVPFLVSFAGGVCKYAVLLSPLFLIIVAGDGPYQAARGFYWGAFVTVQVLGWLLFAWAGFRLRCSIGQEGGVEVARPPPPPAKLEREVGLVRWRPDKEDAGPIEWLAYRQRGVSAVLWVTAVVALAFSRWVAVGSKPAGIAGVPPVWLLLWPLGVAAAAGGGAVVAWVSGRFFASARRTGELELLLPTPVGAESIVTDQWRVLKRTFVWPVVFLQVATVVPVVGMTDIRSTGLSAIWPMQSLVAALLSFVNTYLGTGALCWLGLWFGLAARRQITGLFYAVGLAQGVPWVAGVLASVLGTGMVGPSRGLLAVPYATVSWLPEAIIVLFNIGLWSLAARGVAGSLASAEPLRLDLGRPVLSAARNALAALYKARQWTPS